MALDDINVNFPPNLIDMFSRLRVSEPTTQIAINQSSPVRGFLVSEGEAEGSGTSSSYSVSRASTVLLVGTSVGLRRLKSRVAGLYQAGKSLLYFFTFNLGSGQSNVVKRAGYYDDSDGVFLEQNGTELSWVIRSSSSGSVVETERVTQSNWNQDSFDGTGSGYDFDPTQCHIGFMALEWLGVGDVAVGFVYNRIPVLAHIFQHPNLRSEVYMRTANLFPCYEIEKTVAGGTTATLEAICASLLTEGSQDELGVTYSVSRGITSTYQAATADLYYPLLLFRLNPDNLTSRVKLSDVETLVSTSSSYHLYVVRNPTFNIAYTPNWTTKPNSSLQYDNTIPNTVRVTNAIDAETLTTSSANSKNITSGGSITSTLDFLGSDFGYNPEIWALVIQSDTSNTNIESAIARFWEQI